MGGWRYCPPGPCDEGFVTRAVSRFLLANEVAVTAPDCLVRFGSGAVLILGHHWHH